MLKHLTRQFGLTALGLSLLCASVEIHSTYRLYVQHDNAKFEQVHRAYANAFAHAAAVAAVVDAIDPAQLQPIATMHKINARAK